MANVFLSYAREDTGQAATLARMLERAGFSVWWDRNIEGGSEYTREIDDALKAAEVVVVLWSVHSVGSAWVRDEAASGRDSNRLVPVRLDTTEPPLGFRQYQTIDLSRWKGRDGPALKTLKSAVAAKSKRTGDPARAPSGASGGSEAVSRRWSFVAAVVALLVAAAAAGYFWHEGQETAAPPAIAIVRAPTGGDPARSEALARSLSVEIGSMRTGAFELREVAGDALDGVDYLIQVAASQSGSAAIADVSLLARRDRQILWTSHLEKPASEQSELRAAVATRLQSVLACLVEASGGGERLNQSTLKLYLRGCEKFGDAIPGLVDEDQFSLLRQVTDSAPRFAPAIAHLALIEANGQRFDAARALIAKAKALDPKLGKIYLAEAELLPRSQWRERQDRLAEGLRINPDAAPLHAALAAELSQVGLHNDAVASARRAVELEPASPVIRSSYIQELNYSGRVTEAETELRKAEIVWTGSTTMRDVRYAFDLRVGDPARALLMLRQDQSLASYVATKSKIPNPGIEEFLQARINPTPANIDKAVAAHMIRFRQEPTSFGSMLLSLAVLGRIDQAYDILGHPDVIKALPADSNILFRSYSKKIRENPRFMPLAARIGLVRYWTETGKWSDFCFEPDLPYDCKHEAARLQRAGLVR